MNDQIQDAINNGAGSVPLLDLVMKLSAQDLVFLLVPLLLLLWFWPGGAAQRASNQRIATVTALSVCAALAVGFVVGSFHHEARPFITDLSTRLLIHHSADNSFPSDHTTLAFAVAGSILYWKRGLGTILMGLATLVGIARIYVGVHWPVDILGGAAVGLCTGLLVAQVAPLLVGPQRLLTNVMPTLLIASPPAGTA